VAPNVAPRGWPHGPWSILPTPFLGPAPFWRTMNRCCCMLPSTGVFASPCIGRTMPQHCRSELKTRVIQWPMSEHRGLFIRIPRFHQNELVYLVVWSCKVADPNRNQDRYLTRVTRSKSFVFMYNCTFQYQSLFQYTGFGHSLLYSPGSSLAHASMQPC